MTFDWTTLIPSTQNLVTVMGAATITVCVFLEHLDASILMGIAAAYAFLNGGHGVGQTLNKLGNRLQGGSTAPNNEIIKPQESTNVPIA